MRTAIFGGTFNPVHIGHLVIAEEILVQTGCDSVLFIPANIPPHKEVTDPGAGIRLEMLAKSIADDPRFRASDCEIRRSGISYTIDTVRYLVAAGIVEERPCLVLGDDLIGGFKDWKEPDAIARETSLILVHRNRVSLLSFGYPHLYIDNEPLPVSSTTIRKAIAEGMAWRYLVPEAARKIIEERSLYGLRTR